MGKKADRDSVSCIHDSNFVTTPVMTTQLVATKRDIGGGGGEVVRILLLCVRDEISWIITSSPAQESGPEKSPGRDPFCVPSERWSLMVGGSEQSCIPSPFSFSSTSSPQTAHSSRGLFQVLPLPFFFLLNRCGDTAMRKKKEEAMELRGNK